MRLLKYICLALVLLNLPAIALSTLSSTLGSLLSYATIGLLALYYFLEKKNRAKLVFIINLNFIFHNL